MIKRDGTHQVSTHSRPKAAGLMASSAIRVNPFQHTAVRRRLDTVAIGIRNHFGVSTHSRPKAAGSALRPRASQDIQVSTHSRPKAAGVLHFLRKMILLVSTHSRPKAAGRWQRH